MYFAPCNYGHQARNVPTRCIENRMRLKSLFAIDRAGGDLFPNGLCLGSVALQARHGAFFLLSSRLRGRCNDRECLRPFAGLELELACMRCCKCEASRRPYIVRAVTVLMREALELQRTTNEVVSDAQCESAVR